MRFFAQHRYGPDFASLGSAFLCDRFCLASFVNIDDVDKIQLFIHAAMILKYNRSSSGTSMFDDLVFFSDRSD